MSIVERIGPHAIVNGSVMGQQVEVLLGGEDVWTLYSDPPWNDGMLKMFATTVAKVTGARPAQPTFEEMYVRFASLIRRYVRGHVFIEASVAKIDETADMMLSAGTAQPRALFSAYGSKDTKSAVLYAPMPGNDYAGFDISGLKALPLVVACLRSVARPGAVVLDPCCGAGYTARATMATGMAFRGNEINPARLAITRDWLKGAR